jgi:WD40-like Beta Propeller Repeat
MARGRAAARATSPRGRGRASVTAALGALALGVSALAGCTLVADAGQFEISPATGVDCRAAGAEGKCDGLVPYRCSPESGAWEATGSACSIGCSGGVCSECAAGSIECAADGLGSRSCNAAGRWEPPLACTGEAPRCLDGRCVACLPAERTCIGGVPQSCGEDGRWQALGACPGGEACMPVGGTCAACTEGEQRSCQGTAGACAGGTQTCRDGAWSACSVQPSEDQCQPAGSDDNCDGVPNAPAGGCGACTGPITCDGLAVGICQPGVSACQAGERGPCAGGIGPAARDCGSALDNDCNGAADADDDTCLCDPQGEPASCADYPEVGICRPSQKLCSFGPGNTSSSWGPCTGGVPPAARDCASSLDNDCDGTPDDQSLTCPCREGETQSCVVGGCSGVRQCVASAPGSTSWGSCLVPATWDFTPPELVTGLELTPPIWGPALFADGLGLLVSNGDPEDIYLARRAAPDAPFSAARPLDAINTPQALEGTPFAAASGLYFDSNRNGDRDLWFAPGPPGAWSEPVVLSTVNSLANEQNPWVSADEQLLIFDSNRTGNNDLWASERIAGAFGEPFNLRALNSDASDEGATLTSDGLTVFFASSRDGGAGANDVWLAERATLDDDFSVPTLVPALSSPGDEIDLALSPDGRELLFTSSRDGEYVLYRAERACTVSD